MNNNIKNNTLFINYIIAKNYSGSSDDDDDDNYNDSDNDGTQNFSKCTFFIY